MKTLCQMFQVCQATSDETINYDLGRQDNTVEFQYGDGIAAIMYTAQDKARYMCHLYIFTVKI